MVISFMLAGAFGFAILFCQGWLLKTSGQSLGKKILDIRIVDASTGQLADMDKVFWGREVLTTLVMITPLVVAALVSRWFFLLAILLSVLDIVMGDLQYFQTLHDKLTGTRVVAVERTLKDILPDDVLKERQAGAGSTS